MENQNQENRPMPAPQPPEQGQQPNVYSVEFKLAMVDKFTKSGMSMKSFAQSEGIPANTFWGWIEKAREGGVQGLPPRIPQPMVSPALPPIDITREAKTGAKRGPKPNSKASCKVGGARFTFPSEMLIQVIRELQSK